MSASCTIEHRQTLFDAVLLVRYLPPSKILKYQSLGFTAGQGAVFKGGRKSLLSPAYIIIASPICLLLLRQTIALALDLALASAGSNIAARIAMIAMTTNNSMRVKPASLLPL